jgi:hypothetical protein
MKITFAFTYDKEGKKIAISLKTESARECQLLWWHFSKKMEEAHEDGLCFEIEPGGNEVMITYTHPEKNNDYYCIKVFDCLGSYNPETIYAPLWKHWHECNTTIGEMEEKARKIKDLTQLFEYRRSNPLTGIEKSYELFKECYYNCFMKFKKDYYFGYFMEFKEDREECTSFMAFYTTLKSHLLEKIQNASRVLSCREDEIKEEIRNKHHNLLVQSGHRPLFYGYSKQASTFPIKNPDALQIFCQPKKK